MEKNKIEGDLEANLSLAGEAEVIVKGDLCGPVNGATKLEVEGTQSASCN
ncbi:MAG: hypothetical protein ETSY2_14545 [Candidatus Entotheonella gemina]|uniref:Uncharacterized protein n=1 Tax=Candidatus Entotheonella gemina TaxID=1429439 RepID=W4MB57_9BACT|nr:MAG: hypothetical protein ETSY2_14545 [Candidatus Entotheonella gemina]